MKIGLLGFGVVGRGFYDITKTRDDMPTKYGLDSVVKNSILRALFVDNRSSSL